MRVEAAIPADVLRAIRAPFLAAGAQALDAPILQPLGLLLDLAGESLRERLFVVSSDGGEESCLRPDFTLPALMAHIANGSATGRYLYEGHAFRVAPAGTTRAEEFLQIGLEAFETGDAAEADAEIAALAWRSSVAGGRTDLTLLLGDAGLFAAFVDALEITPVKAARLKRALASPRRLAAELRDLGAAERGEGARGGLARLLAGLGETEAEAVMEEIWILAGIEPIGGRPAGEIIRRLAQRSEAAGAPPLDAERRGLIETFLTIDGEPRAALAAIGDLAGDRRPALESVLSNWQRRLAAFAAHGIPSGATRFSAAFGRSFGYYDGPLFEVRSRALGADQPVAAGGRYDGLPVRLGARDAAGAVGCMVRPGRAWAGARP
ncbi:MAG TPA: ATP phosphoribosyltransferase regulatory subunit [Caulobacteraceae bacterium]|nr:ATP phosphoribosyltransferase regulatory subunit [Caulobacteraceae bacterium]